MPFLIKKYQIYENQKYKQENKAIIQYKKYHHILKCTHKVLQAIDN